MLFRCPLSSLAAGCETPDACLQGSDGAGAVGFFFHMKQALGYPAVITRPLLFAMGFMLFFSIVIALFKDIPDVRGDSRVSPFVSSFQPLQLLMLRACKASSSSTRPFRAISFG